MIQRGESVAPMFKKKKRWKKYHEGYLFRDRIINREVDDVARQMYRLAEKGHGHLVQKKHAAYNYSYYYVAS